MSDDVDLPDLDVRVVTIVADADGTVRLDHQGVASWQVIGLLQTAMLLMEEDIYDSSGESDDEDDD